MSRAVRHAGRFARPALVAAVVVAAAASTAAQTRYPIFTLDNLVSTMKTVGRNFTGVNQSIANNDFEAAKAQLARSREQLALTITFWRDRHRDDAIKMLREALARMDALDATLSAETVDKNVAGAAVKEVGGSCETCHTVYREQDPVTKAYRVKSGFTD
jgi:cytochrome c556